MGNTKLRTQYPLAVKQCFSEAMKYGRCVALSANIQHKECEKEFQDLNRCFMKALSSPKIRR